MLLLAAGSYRFVTKPSQLVWQPFSKATLDEALASGKPVFIDFTADWCITCKTNERFAIDTPKVRQEFSKRNVVALKADWTKGDPGNYADIEAVRESRSADVSGLSRRSQGNAAGASARVDHISNGLGCIEQNLTCHSLILQIQNGVKNEMIKTLLITCGLLAVTAGLSFAETEVGKAAPNFSLPDTNGKTHSLADFKGKYVVLEWYQPDCPFVRKHYRSGNMQALQKEYTAKGVVWLSIDSSAPGEEGNYPAEKLNQIASAGRCRTNRTVAGSGRQCRTVVWCQDHAGHVHHRSERNSRLQRCD